jgi:hypothetical protein
VEGNAGLVGHHHQLEPCAGQQAQALDGVRREAQAGRVGVVGHMLDQRAVHADEDGRRLRGGWFGIVDQGSEQRVEWHGASCWAIL